MNLGDNVVLQIVNGFKAYETARWVGKVQVTGGHTVKTCLSCWHPKKDRVGIPLITEFSFDYDLDDNDGKKDTLEHFHVPTAEFAAALFHSLQKQNGWVQFHATTKTGFAYDAF